MPEFVAPNLDTLTASKQAAVNGKLLEYLDTVNPDSAEYVGYLLSNISKEETQTTKKDVNERLVDTNKKILDVLKKIEMQMIDEQDTSIKHLDRSASKKLEDVGTLVPTVKGTYQTEGQTSSIFDLLDDFDLDRDRDRDREDRQNRNNRNQNPQDRKTSRRGGKRGGLFNKIRDLASKTSDTVADTVRSSRTSSPSISGSPKSSVTPVPDSIKTANSSNSFNKQPVDVPKSATDAAKMANSEAPDAKKLQDASKLKAVSSEVVDSGKQALKTGAGAAKAVAKKAVPVLGAAISIAEGAMAYQEAQNDAERIDAVAENAGAAAGAAIGAVLGTFIPIPGVGTLLGGIVGEWVGRKAGGLIGDLLKDPEDAIPDAVVNQGYEAEIAYIDNELIPKIQVSEQSEEDKKEQIDELNEYKEELLEKIELQKTPEGRRDLLIEKLEDKGIIETNILGSDVVLDWNGLSNLAVRELEDLAQHDGFDQVTSRRIEDILSKKKQETSDSSIEKNEKTVMEALDDAIARQNDTIADAVEKGNEKDAEAAKEQLQKLEQARNEILQNGKVVTDVGRTVVQNAFTTYMADAGNYVDSMPDPVTTATPALNQTIAGDSQMFIGNSGASSFTGSPVSFDSSVKGGDPGFFEQVAQGTTQSGAERCVKVAEFATRNAAAQSQSKCAMYIRIALQQGGGFQFMPRGSAYQYNEVLPGLGFKAYPASEPAKIGDVIVYGRCIEHKHGHIQVWNGKNWVSDFVQRRAVPYKAGYDPTQSITLWRFIENASEIPEVQKEKEANLIEDTKVDSAANNTNNANTANTANNANVASVENSENSMAEATLHQNSTDDATEAEVVQQTEEQTEAIETAVAQATNAINSINSTAQNSNTVMQQSLQISQINSANNQKNDDNLNDLFADEN